MSRDRHSRDWYKPLRKDLVCVDHPKPPKFLVKALAEHLHMSEANTRHMLDRLRHLTHCLNELETMTLFRLQPGANQTVRVIPIDGLVDDPCCSENDVQQDHANGEHDSPQHSGDSARL